MVYTTLVLSGGGFRGIALLGALAKLRESKQLDHIKTIVGISAGSLVATALAMGMDERTVFDQMMNLNISGLRQSSVLNLLNRKRFGLDTGTRLIAFLRGTFTRYGFSGNITFAQLHKITGIVLRVGASNTDTGELHFFSHETDPDCEIVHALRMSCGIPFVFTMWKYHGHYYVDGALKDNFPIEHFIANTTNEAQTGEPYILGLNLKEILPSTPQPISDFIEYAERIFTIMSLSKDEATIKNIPPFCKIIEIACERSSLLSVTKEEKEKLYRIGEDHAVQWNAKFCKI